MASRELKVVVTAKDEASRKFKDMSRQVSESMRKAGKAMTVFGAVGAAALGTAIKAASDFEKQMSDISTLIAGDSTDAVKVFEEGIKDMLKRVPVTAEELGASAYAIVSAGITDAADSLDVLSFSAKLAVAGLGTAEQATDLMTSAINAFGLEAVDSDEIANVLFKTVKNGKTTVSQLAQAFGATAPVIAAAGITLDDFQAATAALTTTGLPAAQAQNSLRQAIVSLQKPTKEMSQLFEEIGVKNMGDLIDSSDNLQDVFVRLRDATEGNDEMMAKAFGSVEALGAVIGLTDTVSEAYVKTLNDMGQMAGGLSEAFHKQSQTFSAQAQILKNELRVALIEIGTVALPIVAEAVGKLSEFIGELTASFSSLSPAMQDTIVKASLFLTAFAAIGGPILILTSFVLPALTSAILAVGAAFIFLASNPIILVIASITALIASIVLLVKHWDQAREKIKIIMDILKLTISTSMQAISNTISSAMVALTESFKEALAGITAVWSGFWGGMKGIVVDAVDFIKGVIDKLVGSIRRVIDKLEELKNKAKGGLARVGGAVTGAVSSVTARFRARGGTVFKGQTAIVGEEGPEQVQFGKTGKVIPNNRLGGASGQTINIILENNTLLSEAPEVAERIGDMIIGQLRLQTQLS